MKKIILTIFLILCLTGSMPANCANYNSFNLIGVIENIINTSNKEEIPHIQDETKQNYLQAVNNIYSGNIVVARSEFSKTVDILNSKISLLMLSKKLYEYGFFTLGDKAVSKIEGQNVLQNQINILSQSYKPSYQLSEDEENYLVKAYSSIYYNNAPEEVAFNLIKKTNLLENSDYANYIMALSMYECKQYNQALIYINKAIDKNEKNSNFKYLKGKILLQTKKYKETLKYIEENENTVSIYFTNKFKILKQKALVNLVSNDSDKKFYQLYAYYLEGNYYKVLKETQNILNFYKNNPKILTLQAMAKLSTGNLKGAKEDFLLSYKQNKNFNLTLMGLADCDFIEGNYKKAYERYKKLTKTELKNEALLKSIIALEHYQPNDKKFVKLNKQKEQIDKVAYYEYYKIANELFSNNEDKEEYAKKSLAINLLNENSYDIFFETEYNKKNFNNLEKIVFILLFSDDMNPKYYYYSAIVQDNKNNKKEAFYEVKKALTLNPDFKPAVDLMNKLQNELI